MSEFNILLGADEPVIIDLPQPLNAAANNHAPRMLVRDVDNLRRFFGTFPPELTATDHGKEIRALYESGALHPDVELTGHFEHVETTVDPESIMREIDSARLETAARQMRLRERG
jgi:RIO kinase 1